MAHQSIFVFKNFLFYLLIFLPHCVACRFLVPQPGIEPVPSAVKAQSPNDWTSREFPGPLSFLSLSNSTVVLLFLIIDILVECSSVPEPWNARVLGPSPPEVHIPTEKAAASVTGNHKSAAWDMQ